MKKYILPLVTAVMLTLMTLLTGCESTSSTTISESTTITYLRMYSPFDDDVKSYVFTVDTVKNIIYNVDSLDYGTRVDSLAPFITPVFNTCVVDGDINLYDNDTVYVDFTKEHTLTVTSKDDEKKKTYKIWVNVHQVNPDTIQWSYLGGLPNDDIIEDKCVATEEGDVFWLLNKNHRLMVMELLEGGQWSAFTTEGISKSVDELDIEHTVAHNDEICVMGGMTLYTSNYGSKWTSVETSSDVELEHLLFSLRGDLYALGKGNKILRLNGTKWNEAAQMPSGFPVRGESVCTGKSPSGAWQATVGCGIDEMGNYLCDFWATENGSYWVKLTMQDSLITPRAYAGIVKYASGIILMGGVDENGDMVEDNSLYSKDYGITWRGIKEEFSIDTTIDYLMARRTYQSMVNTTGGYLLVVGGRYFYPKVPAIPSREKSHKSNDVWKGMHFASLPGFKK